jgi:hypothetical protein
MGGVCQPTALEEKGREDRGTLPRVRKYQVTANEPRNHEDEVLKGGVRRSPERKEGVRAQGRWEVDGYDEGWVLCDGL